MATSKARSDRKLQSVDPIWDAVRTEAEAAIAAEPALGGFIFATVLSHDRLEDAVCHRLAQRLNHADVDAQLISRTFEQVLERSPDLGRAFRADLFAVRDRDPACTRFIEPLLYFKGFHALVTYRFAHALHDAGRQGFLQVLFEALEFTLGVRDGHGRWSWSDHVEVEDRGG